MDVLDVDDLSVDRLHRLLDDAARLRDDPRGDALAGRTVALLFEQPSTRTRVSFEAGTTQLGGHAVFLAGDDLQLGHGEPIEDTARALSGYVDAIVARVPDPTTLAALADYSDVPVVNGLSDEAHPAQTLADLRTIRDHLGDGDATVAWIGDGNNVGSSFLVGAAMAGLDVRAATPPGYDFRPDVYERAAAYEGSVTRVETPAAAVADADVVYTDVWVNMSDVDEREERLAAFADYQVNEALLARSDALVMHCLPAHRGEEITDAVMESERSIVWDQAENRLHAGKALLADLIGDD